MHRIALFFNWWMMNRYGASSHLQYTMPWFATPYFYLFWGEGIGALVCCFLYLQPINGEQGGKEWAGSLGGEVREHEHENMLSRDQSRRDTSRKYFHTVDSFLGRFHKSDKRTSVDNVTECCCYYGSSNSAGSNKFVKRGQPHPLLVTVPAT